MLEVLFPNRPVYLRRREWELPSQRLDLPPWPSWWKSQLRMARCTSWYTSMELSLLFSERELARLPLEQRDGGALLREEGDFREIRQGP